MRILLAEPSRIGTAILSKMLTEDGHEVVCCHQASAALTALQSETDFDVLITAIEFESMSGFELTWEARLHAGEGRPIYVIVLSSSSDEHKLVEALDCGADDFITKPPRKSELLARLRAAARLLCAQRDLIRLASFDSLTGMWNRRAFFEHLEKCHTSTEPFSIIMLDIDYFKKINDTHGHEVGDDVLREMGKRLTRIDKTFARLGGEEFGLLVKAPLHEAADQAEAARRLIAGSCFKTGAGPLEITVSIGVAERKPGCGFEDTIKDADVALYASKSGGRNRVTVSRTATEGRRSDMDLTKMNQARVA